MSADKAANPVTRIHLLRHGECAGGALLRGRTDSPLSDNGRLQMQTALERLPVACWDAICSSPLTRCAAFARAWQSANGGELHLCPALRELDFGAWDGQPVEQLAREQGAAWEAFQRDPGAHPPPGGETLAALQQRLQDFWQTLLESQRGRRLLLITHGGVVRALLGRALGMTAAYWHRLHVPHAGLSELHVYHAPGHPDWVQLVTFNARA